MEDVDDAELTISQRRVKLYHARESTARVMGSILIATGAVEALSQNTPLQGVFAVIIGLALEREAKDASLLTTMAVLILAAPAAVKFHKASKRELVSTIEAFTIAIRCSCIYMALRLLFWSRRLRQLGELQKPKEL